MILQFDRIHMSVSQIAMTVLFAGVLVTVLNLLVGCTPNAPYRTSYAEFDPNGPDHEKAVIETCAEYKLGFVEFDDQGRFWDLRQRAAVEQLIRTEAGIDGSPTAKPQGIILVAFVHGWKDNASYDGDGVAAFRAILTQLSDAEHSQTDHPPRKVVGVYGGWRGLSATWEPFKELTFYERKNTAHKVGGYGAMTRLMVDLENLQQDSLASLPADAPRTELIIIGHSFGGAAVYSALSQIITERFANTIEKGKRLKPMGDQIILLNPAFEAVRHFDLNQMATAIQQFPEDQRPVLSIFTSRGDWATHFMFPLGRFFSTIFEKNRDGEQKASTLEAVGWYEPFLTHHLIYDAKDPSKTPAVTQPTTAPVSTFNLTTQQHEFHSREKLQKSVANAKAQRSRWNPRAVSPKTYPFDDTTLQPLDRFHPGDPFLIVSVDKQIMADHSDITNKVLINFIREYIQFCQVDAKDHSK